MIIKEVTSKKEMKQFVTFPFSLYKDCKYWVPPIIKDELESFDPKKNPVFEYAKARYFLAYKNNKIVGRIAIIINTNEIEKQQIKKLRFGWFDVIDDIEVSSALINKAKEIGKQHHLTHIEGPLGFNNLDKTGVLVEGFDHIGTMITWYNYPYYKEHLEQLGFVKEKEYLENKFQFKKSYGADYSRIAKILEKRMKLKPINFENTKDIMPYVDEMFALFDQTYSKLSTYVPISKKTNRAFQKKVYQFY